MIKIIPQTARVENITENTMSIRYANEYKTIAFSTNDHIGLLCMMPIPDNITKWYMHALYSSRDYWGETIKDTAIESISTILSWGWDVYQFDTIQEFAEWSLKWCQDHDESGTR